MDTTPGLFFGQPNTHLLLDLGPLSDRAICGTGAESSTEIHANVTCPDCRRICGCRDCLTAELAAMGDAECGCSSAPTPCEDCTRYYEIAAKLGLNF